MNEARRDDDLYPVRRTALTNPDAEICVLSILSWLGEDAVDKRWILSALSPKDFYSKDRRKIYQAIRKVHERGEDVDPFTVQSQLTRDGASDSVSFFYDTIGKDSLAIASQAKGYVEAVLDASRRRVLFAHFTTTAQGLEDPTTDFGELMSETKARIADADLPLTVDHEAKLRAILLKLADEYGKGNERTFKTGYPRIDYELGGLKIGELAIVLGRPKTGKSWLLINLIANLMRGGRKIMISSAEMSAEELAARLVCRLGRINHRRYRKEELNEDEISRFVEASSKLSNSNVAIIPKRDAPSLPKLLSLALDFKPDIIAVDSVYLYAPRRASEGWEYYVAISRELKNLSLECESLVLATHQKNKSGHIAYSDAFWQDANFLLELEGDELSKVVDGKSKHSLAVRGRDGGAFRFDLSINFDSSTIGEASRTAEEVKRETMGVEPTPF